MRNSTVRVTLSSIFQAVQGGLGVSVVPSHFYFPVPKLKSFQGKDWAACRPCTGINFRIDEQIQRLHSDILPYAGEWNFPELANGDAHKFHFNNGFFERVDVEVLYSFIRHRKPKRIIEIGSGNSTLVMATAIRRNEMEGAPCELTSIEPHPAPFLKDGLNGLHELIEKPVQEVSLEVFRRLGPGDILFIDSSHVVSMDSDVLYEILKIVPQVRKGVLIHFHDIFTPLDYPEKFVMTNLCFWGEQYLLESFLQFNCSFNVVWASSAMQQFHPEVLETAFPGWRGSFDRMPHELKVFAPTLDNKSVMPCSFWIERVAA